MKYLSVKQHIQLLAFLTGVTVLVYMIAFSGLIWAIIVIHGQAELHPLTLNEQQEVDPQYRVIQSVTETHLAFIGTEKKSDDRVLTYRYGY